MEFFFKNFIIINRKRSKSKNRSMTIKENEAMVKFPSNTKYIQTYKEGKIHRVFIRLIAPKRNKANSAQEIKLRSSHLRT
jgi:hypothetical protein